MPKMYTTYNYNTDAEWEAIQKRTLDPYALLQSDTLNRINSIYGNNIIITGFDMSALQRDDYLLLIMEAGKAIKDSVLIEITERVSIKLENKSDEFLDDFAGGKETGLVVLNYKYEKIYPAPQAKIEFIKESEYDPENQLILYRIVFAEDGSIELMSRAIMPKDNVIYEEMLAELESVAKSSVKVVLAELGNRGIAELIACYLRVYGTSISGNWTTTSKYYLLKTASKYNYRDLLEVRLAINVGQEYYYSKYIMHEVQSINSGIVLDVNYESLSSINTDLYAINKYASIIVYEDDNNFNFYLKLDGIIRGRVEVLQTDAKSDQVEVLNIEESDGPKLNRETAYWKSSDIKSKPTSLYLNGYLVWSQYNMGHTSGLDADLLDGHEADYFVSNDAFEEYKTGIDQEIADLKDDLGQSTTNINDKIANLESYFSPVENTNLDKVVLQSEKSVPNGIPILNSDGVVPDEQLNVRFIDGRFFHADDVAPTGTEPLVGECYFTATRIYNPVYKDIAECFECNADTNMKNALYRIVSLDYTTGKLRLASPLDPFVVGVVSDTYGVLLGGKQADVDAGVGLLPVAVCGTAWVKLEEMEDNKNYLGNLVGPGNNGYGRIVARAQPHVGMIIKVNEGDCLVKILVKTSW